MLDKPLIPLHLPYKSMNIMIPTLSWLFKKKKNKRKRNCMHVSPVHLETIMLHRGVNETSLPDYPAHNIQ